MNLHIIFLWVLVRDKTIFKKLFIFLSILSVFGYKINLNGMEHLNKIATLIPSKQAIGNTKNKQTKHLSTILESKTISCHIEYEQDMQTEQAAQAAYSIEFFHAANDIYKKFKISGLSQSNQQKMFNAMMKKCQNILKKHFPNNPHLHNKTKLNACIQHECNEFIKTQQNFEYQNTLHPELHQQYYLFLLQKAQIGKENLADKIKSKIKEDCIIQ